MLHYADLNGQKVSQVYLVHNRDVAPVVGVHPSVHGLVIMADTEYGSVFVLDRFSTEDESDEAYARGFRLQDQIERHLTAGGALDAALWSFVRTIFGFPAREAEFGDELEVATNLGHREEFLSM